MVQLVQTLYVLGLLPRALTQVVQWDISRRSDLPLLRRRGSTLGSTIENVAQAGYFAKVNIGSPGQELTLQLDTGSSDVWVPYSSASICGDRSSGGCPYGSCATPFPSLPTPLANMNPSQP